MTRQTALRRPEPILIGMDVRLRRGAPSARCGDQVLLLHTPFPTILRTAR